MDFNLLLTQQKVRILVATPFRLLGETLKSELSAIQSFQLSLTSAANFGLLEEIKRARAHIVVILTEGDDEPGIVSHIFDAYPGIFVVVSNQQNGEAVICKQRLTKRVVHKAKLVELLKQITKEENCDYWGKTI